MFYVTSKFLNSAQIKLNLLKTKEGRSPQDQSLRKESIK